MKRAPAANASSVPIVLPVVEIRIDAAGSVSVTIDAEPYEVDPTLGRDGVRLLVQDLANTYGPIRVVIVEANGESYVDIETPRDDVPTPGPADLSALQPADGPFRPGEDVLAAVVVDGRKAGSSGKVSLRVPPAIADRYGSDVYLIGRTSRVVVHLTDLEHE